MLLDITLEAEDMMLQSTIGLNLYYFQSDISKSRDIYIKKFIKENKKFLI